jgi:putative nucleotidyltransferase with HDIG domain
LEPTHLQNFLNTRVIEKNDIFIESEELFTIAELFAQVVDAKSPYTAEHSVGVARLSKYIGSQLGLDSATCSKIEVAGLLHDLGKLQVPDDILEKTTDLDSDDLCYMRHHSYVSYAILRKIKGMEDIAQWAANHHEALDGSGYPFHRTANELCTESRIIMTADIFQALAQNRPYRQAMAVEDIIHHLQDMSHNGKLDREIVQVISLDSSNCYRYATSQTEG